MLIENDTLTIDTTEIPSPSFIVDQQALKHNLAVLDHVQQQTGAKVLLALKGFAMFSTFSLLSKTLAGVCASSIDEALLGKEEFGKEVHTFSPAYSEESLKQILNISNHVVFNSPQQWKRFKHLCIPYANNVQFGLRINPEHSEGKVAIYDPCSPFSRLGMTLKEFEKVNLDGISGIHFHTLCEQNSFALERTLKTVEEKFGKYLHQMKWINFGGGHHITRPNYDVDHLCKLISNFKNKYNMNIYLEPGEAVALNAGIYVTTVLDIINNEMNIAIIDGSASTHLPDVLEMPYRPTLIGAGKPNKKQHTYRIAGNSCLAGDIIGDYSFDKPLNIGDKLIFTDMAHYTMVKTTTFNGVRLPIICLYNNGKLQIIKKFDYEDFKNRLS